MTQHTEWTLNVASRIAAKYDGIAGGASLSEGQMRVLDECAHYQVKTGLVELHESGHMVVRSVFLGRSGSAEIDRAGHVVAEW